MKNLLFKSFLAMALISSSVYADQSKNQEGDQSNKQPAENIQPANPTPNPDFDNKSNKTGFFAGALNNAKAPFIWAKNLDSKRRNRGVSGLVALVGISAAAYYVWKYNQNMDEAENN